MLTSSLSPFCLNTVCHPPLSPIVGTTPKQVAWRAIMLHILAVYEKVRRYSDTWKHRRRMNNVLTHTIELTAGEPRWPIQCVCVWVCACHVCITGWVSMLGRTCTLLFSFLMSACMCICTSMWSWQCPTVYNISERDRECVRVSVLKEKWERWPWKEEWMTSDTHL